METYTVLGDGSLCVETRRGYPKCGAGRPDCESAFDYEGTVYCDVYGGFLSCPFADEDGIVEQLINEITDSPVRSMGEVEK